MKQLIPVPVRRQLEAGSTAPRIRRWRSICSSCAGGRTPEGTSASTPRRATTRAGSSCFLPIPGAFVSHAAMRRMIEAATEEMKRTLSQPR